MPGDKAHIITQREKLVLYRSDQSCMIAAGKICPPDGALEQNIANLGKPTGCMIKNDMSRGMTWAMQDIKLNLAELNLIPVKQPAIRCKGSHVRKTEHLALFWHPLDPETIFLMRPFNGHLDLLKKRRNTASMVNMPMRDQYLCQRQILCRQYLQYA